MKKQIGLTLLLLVLALRVQAQNSVTNSGCATNPPDFIHSSYQEASAAVDSEFNAILVMNAKKICPEYITNLVSQIRHGQLDNDKNILAIWFLGELHPNDTNSIEVLIENIDLKAPKTYTSFAPRLWGDYPAEEALMKIGKPVIDPLLNHLPTETSELRRQLMCDVLKQVWRENKTP